MHIFIYIHAPTTIIYSFNDYDLLWIFGAEDEREFDYVKDSEKGPEHWGELKKEWAACKHGKLQSPIDLSNKRVKVIPKLGDIKTNYRPSNATIKNRGHDIAVRIMNNVF